jgi:hypothetical protein
MIAEASGASIKSHSSVIACDIVHELIDNAPAAAVACIRTEPRVESATAAASENRRFTSFAKIEVGRLHESSGSASIIIQGRIVRVRTGKCHVTHSIVMVRSLSSETGHEHNHQIRFYRAATTGAVARRTKCLTRKAFHGANLGDRMRAAAYGAGIERLVEMQCMAITNHGRSETRFHARDKG